MDGYGLPPLHALEIVVAPHLKGSKRAVRFGAEARIHVSPAMYDLIRHANAEELATLMRAIEIVNLPPLPSFSDPLPMTMYPGAK